LTNSDEENNLRIKLWRIINLIQANQLFVHSKNLEIKYYNEDAQKVDKRTLPEILSLCVLNAMVPNSAMLLVGGHGGGKTSICKILGRMFTSDSLKDIERAIVRGHPQLYGGNLLQSFGKLLTKSIV
jgi:ABC-type uncharacterized transport system fused permease/ATPase subunit